jgi:hypothetical protein
MMTSEEERWLLSTFSGLVSRDGVVAGTISFTAAYNPDTKQFLRLGHDIVDDIGGISLFCTYAIHLQQPPENLHTRLPALLVDGVEPIADRHFRKNKNACLCSPLEERDFLSPKFDFNRFFEELVIPFLYGQSFYSEYHRWPWPEYAHNATGLLESFHDRPLCDTADLERFVLLLSLDSEAWPKLQAALGRKVVKGHIPCFCPEHDQIRRCHPKALLGLRSLRQLVRARSLALPS